MKYGSSYPAPVGRLAQRRTECGDKCLVVLALAEANFPVPSAGGDTETAHGNMLATRDGESYSEADAAGPQSARPQAHGSFVEQFVRDRPRLLGGAHLGCEHMRMADGLEVLGLGHVEVLTLQPMP